MNPTTNGGPELQLPAPITPNQMPEAAIGQALPLPDLTPNLAERAPLLPLPIQAPMPSLSPLPSLAGLPSAATPLPSDVANTTVLPIPAVADDQDLIEKEWVNKAKQIVEKTRDNPYQQSQELTIFKNDYMQKRYNKIIKMAE